MKFVSESNLIFVGIKTDVSKKGDPFSMAVFDDPLNYERSEMFFNRNVTFDGIERGQELEVTVDCTKNGFRWNVFISGIKPAKKELKAVNK